ncbi:MAG: (deoxy)nucleoside triphosphate pyrophosphohydrolase [Clostridia bacterium]|nr:(deoxy)nucleoside triphosphate pyrophosphohydrolase [Clostridia bacterium]
MERRTIEVVAALIWRGERFLACQRPPEKARGLLWEFVGGKVESGESGSEALVRECREELDVTLSVGEAFMDVTHAYPDLTVHLTLYEAVIAQGEPKKLEHHDIRWITVEEMDALAFCPADQVFLNEIRRRHL